LKERIEGQNSKITLTGGRSPWKRGLQTSPAYLERKDDQRVDDYGMKHAQFINFVCWENEKGMQPKKSELHPFLSS
jgi:hypothetical protein